MDNGIIEKTSLLSGSVSIKVESKKDSLNSQMVNNTNNNYLLDNKSRKHSIDGPRTATKYTDVPECKNIKPLDELPATSTDDSTLNNQQSKFKQLRLKVLSVGSLTITLVPNTKYTDVPKCEDTEPVDILPTISTDDSTFNNQQSKFKQFFPKLSSNDSLSITLVPDTECTNLPECEDIEPADILPTASIDDSTFNDQSKLKEFCAKFLSNNSLSITKIPNTKSTDTPECEAITPIDVLSTTSIDNSTCNNQQPKLKQFFPKLLSNDSLSITLVPSTEFTDLLECKNIESADILPTTSTDDSMCNNQQSKLKQVFPKLLSKDNSLSVTLVPNTEYTDLPECENTKLTDILSTISTGDSICNNQRSKLKQFFPALSSNDSLSITLVPNTKCTDLFECKDITPIDMISITLTDDSMYNNQQSKFKQFFPKSSSDDNSLSITLVPNTEYTDLLECEDIELCNIFSITSTDDSTSINQQLLPKPLPNDSLRITLEQSKKILNNEYTEIINSAGNLKSTGLTNGVFKTIFVADADDGSTFVSEYSQTSFEKIPNEISAYSSLNMTLKPRIKQTEQLAAINFSEVVNSTVILKSTSKENTEPIGILPLTSASSCTLPSCLKQILPKKSLQPNHDNIATTLSNCHMPKIMSSSEEESVKNFNASDQLSSYTEIRQDLTDNINQISISSFKPVLPNAGDN